MFHDDDDDDDDDDEVHWKTLDYSALTVEYQRLLIVN